MTKKRQRVLFWIILGVGAICRLIALGKYPSGIHRDEAYAGYEALSLIREGTDSWGYPYPLYFNSWGSGMNVLESYLMIPFIKVFGFGKFAVRLPEALLSIVSIVCAYHLLKRRNNENYALLGMFLLTICPWHIMMSRWGLESFLCVPMILLGTFFLLKGLDPIIKGEGNSAYLILAAFFFGLDLYCYAATWMPLAGNLFILAITIIIYCRKREIKLSKKDIQNMILSVLLLFLMALPLILFILINVKVMDEIKGVISIPRMTDFRGDEIFNVRTFKERIEILIRMLLLQDDGQVSSAFIPFGLFYLWSLPCIIVGLVTAFKEAKKELKDKKFPIMLLFLIYIFSSYFISIVQGISIIRTSFIQIAVVLLWTKGVWMIIHKNRLVLFATLAIYVGSFVCFILSYFTIYQDRIGTAQYQGLQEAISVASDIVGREEAETICLSPAIEFSYILYYTQMPTEVFQRTVKWRNYPYKYLIADALGGFVWEDFDKEGIRDDVVYIIREKEKPFFEAAGYEIIRCDEMYVVYESRYLR